MVSPLIERLSDGAIRRWLLHPTYNLLTRARAAQFNVSDTYDSPK